MNEEMTVIDSINNEIVKIEYKLSNSNKWRLLNIIRTGEFANDLNKNNFTPMSSFLNKIEEPDILQGELVLDEEFA